MGAKRKSPAQKSLDREIRKFKSVEPEEDSLAERLRDADGLNIPDSLDAPEEEPNVSR